MYLHVYHRLCCESFDLSSSIFAVVFVCVCVCVCVCVRVYVDYICVCEMDGKERIYVEPQRRNTKTNKQTKKERKKERKKEKEKEKEKEKLTHMKRLRERLQG